MLSPLEMFNIGIGSSSSHTVGPMKAALEFVTFLEQQALIKEVKKLKVELFGSLALTGEGHGTPRAIISGLCGENPKDITTDSFTQNYVDAVKKKQLSLLGKYLIKFDPKHDILLEKNKFLPDHANAMRFSVFADNENLLLAKEYFSIGGGFILDKDGNGQKRITKRDPTSHPSEKSDLSYNIENQFVSREKLKNEFHSKAGMTAENLVSQDVPYKFSNATELFALCNKHGMSIAELVMQNELSYRSKTEIENTALEIIEAMSKSVERGISSDLTTLPGGINLARRAPGLYKKLNLPDIGTNVADQRLMAMTFAMAVNEENAAFGKIVTAPTNGSAGTIAGVLEYYRRFCPEATREKQIEFILTSGAIGVLYKMGASISAAEVGCQGEIGVSCSMATGGLTAVLGGTLKQVERAAEIAMEHSLGMTCDPVNGLVQIPCIERNGVAASRAIDIAKLVLLESGEGNISLDEVIKTMLQTGRDMNMHYKETALGGLAVNHVNC